MLILMVADKMMVIRKDVKQGTNDDKLWKNSITGQCWKGTGIRPETPSFLKGVII